MLIKEKKARLKFKTQARTISPLIFHKIGDICSSVNTVRNARELLEASLKQTMELFGANRGSIFILKENGKDLILKIAEGMKRDEEEKMVKRLGEGIVGKVAQLKKPFFVRDIKKDKRFKNYKPRGEYQTPSFICTPLIVKDKLIGVINIADKVSGEKFTHEEMQVLDFLSSQIALNYRRIELYHKMKNIIRETRNLKDKLGQTDEETRHLKKQIVIQEKLATIGKLAGGIAHEFNNPLDGIMRYTNLCLEHSYDNEILHGYLMEIKQGLNRMANIVKNLIACSREEIPRRQKVDVRQDIERCLKGVSSLLIQKNIVVEKKIQENLPQIQDLGLDGIMTNIIRNAIDSIREKGKITLRAYTVEDDLVIAVSDTGCGIKEENIEKIFEPFFTTKDIDKGCGLGLTIVAEIMKAYNGRIHVESALGKGTTFTISLPLL